MIGVVDYGVGNLTSVAGALRRLGVEPVVSADPATLRGADKLILPGVGAFGDGMRNLRERGLIELLNELVLEDRRPILGICLGSQLVTKESEEFGHHAGLGWIRARVRRLAPDQPSLGVPHMGWDDLAQVRDCPLFDGVPADALFYYVHSYRIDSDDVDAVVGTCDYGGQFAAVLWRQNIYATQFHPEKSQRHGLTLLRNFLERA